MVIYYYLYIAATYYSISHQNLITSDCSPDTGKMFTLIHPGEKRFGKNIWETSDYFDINDPKS